MKIAIFIANITISICSNYRMIRTLYQSEKKDSFLIKSCLLKGHTQLLQETPSKKLNGHIPKTVENLVLKFCQNCSSEL